MRIGITAKIVILVICSVLISALAVLIAGRFAFETGFSKEYDRNIKAFKNVGHDWLNKQGREVATTTHGQATRSSIIAAIDSANTAELQRISQELIGIDDIKGVIFTDAAGHVLVEAGETEGFATALPARQSALAAGRPQAGFVAVSGNRLPYIASEPVHKDGRVIGAVSLSNDPADKNLFVDALQSMLGVEATIFSGNTRISSTIIENGQRVIGTTIEDPEIKNQVLGEGKPVFKRLSLFQKPYIAAYWPLLDAAGKPVGIGFIGKSMHELTDALGNVNQTAALSTVITALILIACGLLFARWFAKPILRLANFSGEVAKGHLEAELTVAQNDEVGDLAKALHGMVGTLREKIAEAHDATTTAREESAKAQQALLEAESARRQGESARRQGILDAAARLRDVVAVLNTASTDLNERIEQSRRGSGVQSERIGTTATAMEEMNATVLEVAQNASQAATTADSARKQAEDGTTTVSEAVACITDVRDQALVLKEDMDHLGEQANSIGAVISVINDIADQTNLLALNAAIEAARAGEAGRGFAVVADEVRKLAEKTMNATKEVSTAIHGIQQGTKKNVDHVERSVSVIAEATTKAENSGQVLGEIVNLVHSASDQIRAIATATEEQSAATEEISRSIVEINTISTETSQAMTEAADAVSELSGQAAALVELIESMQREAAGEEATTARALPAPKA